jgi:hypothetical protein
MPQSVGYGEAEILRVGIRPVEALPTERLPPAPELAVESAAKFRTGLGLGCAKTSWQKVDALPLGQCESPMRAVLQGRWLAMTMPSLPP